MSILKYKYQAHKIINYVFYLIVFVIGFLLGFGAKKIDFNNLIGQVLMIENVQAYTLFERTTGSYPITIDENYLMEKITLIDENFDLKTHSNVICVTNSNSNSMWTSYEFSYKPDGTHGAVSGSSGYKIDCYFISTDTINQITSISYSGNSSANHNFSPTITGDIKKLSIMLGTNSSSLSSTGYMLYQTLSSLDKINTYSTGGSLGVYLYTNFDYSYSLIKNTLDFSEYIVNLEFNEDLFKNNENFKEVCVEEGKTFAITSTEMSDINSLYDYDYIWFPYNLNGLSKILYDNSTDSNEIHFTEEESKERYFYNTKENIDSFYSSDIPGSELKLKGYTDKYSYYGWSAWPFRVYYSESNNQYNIFTLKNPTKIYIGNLGSDGSVHGGGGLRLDGDEEIEISTEYCFYIKNIYEVTYVNIDEWGDYFGTVPTPNGDYDFSTSHNKLNSNTDSFLSQPIKFINSMKDTINFINSLIYEFYISLPVLLRTFIITLLIILMIMLIMRIGGYN